MIRNTNSEPGRYTIYTVVLLSFLGIVLVQVLGVPYEIAMLILIGMLLITLLNMNRFIRWSRERRGQRFRDQLAEKQKDHESV